LSAPLQDEARDSAQRHAPAIEAKLSEGDAIAGRSEGRDTFLYVKVIK
jgi:hypothetical protein